jgi:hypothetical protein
MGLGDVVSKILLEVKSDTSQAKADLKSLKGVQKEVFQSQLDSVEAGNKALDKWVGRLGQIGVALGAVKLAFDSVQEYGHKLDLQAASAGVSIDGLRKASLGLKTEMELLEHAARMNNSAFKLTQDQMEDVERAMYVLEERGNDSKEVWAAIDKAITTGATKPLEQFGIIIDKTGLALDENGLKVDTFGQKQEALRRVMEAVSRTAEGAKDAQHDAADAMQVELVKLNDFWHEMKMQLAQVVIQLTPVLKGLADAVSLAADLVNKMPSWMKGGAAGTFGDTLTGSPLALYEELFGGGEKKTDFSWQNAYRKYGDASTVSMGAGPSGPSGFDAGKFLTFTTSIIDELEKRNKKSKPGEFNPGGWGTVDISGGDESGLSKGRLANGFSTSLGAAADTRQFNEFGAEQTEGMLIKAERMKTLTSDWFAELDAYDAKHKGLLEKTIGPIEQFDAYAEGFKMLGETMQVAGGAWSNALKEIGTSTDSLGKIAKKAFATIVMGIGEKLAAQSASHLVEALANTALLNPVEAGKHYAAAGIYGAGAIAAFATAKAMGAGGGAQPAKPSGGAAAGGSASGGTGYAGDPNGKYVKQEQPKVYVIGTMFGNMSVRERARAARETVAYANGYVGGEDS